MTDDLYSEYDESAISARPDLETALDALAKYLDSNVPDATIIYGLSGLSRDQVDFSVQPVWAQVPVVQRRRIMRQLIEASEANIELEYRSIGFLGLADPDPGVREAAIEVLWEDDSLELMTALVQLALHDEAISVRAAATMGLSRFILKGELGELPEQETRAAQNAAISLLTSEAEDVSVRRRALEAIANSSHDIVPSAIKAAYNSSDQLMRVSAVFAMGRSCDTIWEDIVLEELDSMDAEMRYEAARASGELQIVEAVPKLAELALEDDREILEAAVWSLGEIGSKEAVRILDALAEKAEDEDDDELIQAIEEALGNASLVGDDLPDLWSIPFDDDEYDD
ncbi:MAG: HEAT repeat domain-containing protein [Anaerolineae bacterium]